MRVLLPLVNLCPACRHARVITTGKGSRFLLCRLSESDPRSLKYPPQPLLRCRGYEPVDDIEVPERRA